MKPPAEERLQQAKKEHTGDMERKGNGHQLSRHVIANARNAANVGTTKVVVGYKSASTTNEHAVIIEAISENTMSRAVARVEIDRHQKEKRASARGEAPAPGWRRLKVRNLAGAK